MDFTEGFGYEHRELFTFACLPKDLASQLKTRVVSEKSGFRVGPVPIKGHN